MKKHVITYKKLYIFIMVAYLISWGSLLFGNVEYSFFWFLAKFGFTLSAIIVFLLYKDTGSKERVIQYSKNFKPIYIVIGLAPLLAYFISILMLVPFDELRFVRNEHILKWGYVLLISPASGILFYSLFRGGLGEEIGLRGFAVPFLAKKHSLFQTAFIIGVFWSIWHYPIWFSTGVLNLIVGTVATIAWSGIFTYLFAKTKSLGLVILLHATGNAADDIFEWMLPSIKEYDWEIVYILVIVLAGIISYILLKKTINPFIQIVEDNNE